MDVMGTVSTKEKRWVHAGREAAEVIEDEDGSVLLGLWKLSVEDVYPWLCSVH